MYSLESILQNISESCEVVEGEGEEGGGRRGGGDERREEGEGGKGIETLIT